MFRQAAANLLARGIRARTVSTDVPAAQTADSSFVEAWKKLIPNIDPQKSSLSFMQSGPATPFAIPSKLTVNFVFPYASQLANKEVDLVIIPAVTGKMGVLAGHVETISEAKPGVLSVHEGNEVTKYFIS